MYYVYVLRSIKFGKYYIGSTNNIINRLKKHNSGLVKSTKSFKPWKLAYSKVYNTRSEAFKREKYLKSLKKRSAIEKIIGHHGPIV